MCTYESTLVAALPPPPRLDHPTQQSRVDLSSGTEHLLGALAQNGWVSVQAGEVKAHEQCAGLNIVDAVGKEVGDGLGDLVRGDIDDMVRSLGPQTAQEVFDVNDWRRQWWAGAGLDQIRLRVGCACCWQQRGV